MLSLRLIFLGLEHLGDRPFSPDSVKLAGFVLTDRVHRSVIR